MSPDQKEATDARPESVGDHGPEGGPVGNAGVALCGDGRGSGEGLPWGPGDGVAHTRRAMARSARGYFGVVAWHTKAAVNVGTLWRSASIFGAAFVGTIGKRYDRQGSDTMQTPRHTPLWHFTDEADFWAHIPHDCQPVAVEIVERARPLATFAHPRSAVYVLGPEDGSLPPALIAKCRHVVRIPGAYCLNMAVAGSVVMYDRAAKQASR